MGALQPSRIFTAGSSVRAPSGSQKPRSGQLAGPGCAASSEPRRRQLSQDRQKVLLILGAGCAVRNARDPAGSLTPAVQSGAPRRVSEPQERTGRRPWMPCRPSRILDVGRTVGTPRRISKVQEWAIPPPGCAAAFRILKAGHTAKVPGGISQSQERECEEIDPLLLCVFSLLF